MDAIAATIIGAMIGLIAAIVGAREAAHHESRIRKAERLTPLYGALIGACWIFEQKCDTDAHPIHDLENQRLNDANVALFELLVESGQSQITTLYREVHKDFLLQQHHLKNSENSDDEVLRAASYTAEQHFRREIKWKIIEMERIASETIDHYRSIPSFGERIRTFIK